MQESPLFAKVHDLLVWLIPLTLKFPREHRFVIAAQVQNTAFELQSRLLDARHGLNQAQSLRRSDSCLARLRAQLRLCLDWLLIAPRQFEHVSGRLVEIGRLLGAWIRSVVKSANAVEAA
jgi:hypothetical protein